MNLTPVTEWSCPNCYARDTTREADPHTRYHTCPGLRGLSAPMVRAGTRVNVEAVEREDYVRAEDVTFNEDGRAIMAVRTEHIDGRTDLAVFAPCATGDGKAP